MYGPPDLPDIEQLTSREAAERSPGELSAHLRHQMGEADPPARQRDPASPDVSDLRSELGL